MMCRVKHYKSHYCEHHWLEIAEPCGDEKGFNNCAKFNGSYWTPAAETRVFLAPQGTCPYHDKKGDYDFNKIRVIEKLVRGWRFGISPGRRDVGVEAMCCVMM
jgi:hypothetical protein